jgi:transporter family-2 protein
MITTLLFGLLALFVGIGISFQSAINASLARGLESALLAATVSFSVGTVALLAVAFVSGQLSVVGASWRSIPMIYWFAGGVLGAGFVASATFLVPRIGVASLLSFAIAGQLLSAVVIDHFGLINVAERAMTLGRGIGLVLLLIGAFLVSFA